MDSAKICPICQQILNRRGQVTTQCSECSKIYHRHCVNLSYHNILNSFSWKCSECTLELSTKSPVHCELCTRTRSNLIIYSCEKCYKSYHRSCLAKESPVCNYPGLGWMCKKCFSDSQRIRPLKIRTELDKKLPRGIKIGHVNVRNLLSKSKKDDVRIIIQHYNFDVFAVTESWLKPDVMIDEIDVANYQLLRADRPGQKVGGGILLYIKSEFIIVDTTTPFSAPVESIAVTLKRPHLPQIKIIAIYRPENSPTSFIDKFQDVLTSHTNEETYILGDFNLDQLSEKAQPYKLKNVIYKCGFKQIINRPTRITSTSETLLDLMITNNPQLIITSGVWPTHLADHEITYLVRKRPKLVKG